jgi:hypothetical protein
MLTFTAVMIGLLLMGSTVRSFNNKVETGWDMVAIIVGLATTALVVWQFYFVMLPLAWGAK